MVGGYHTGSHLDILVRKREVERWRKRERSCCLLVHNSQVSLFHWNSSRLASFCTLSDIFKFSRNTRLMSFLDENEGDSNSSTWWNRIPCKEIRLRSSQSRMGGLNIYLKKQWNKTDKITCNVHELRSPVEPQWRFQVLYEDRKEISVKRILKITVLISCKGTLFQFDLFLFIPHIMYFLHVCWHLGSSGVKKGVQCLHSNKYM